MNSKKAGGGLGTRLGTGIISESGDGGAALLLQQEAALNMLKQQEVRLTVEVADYQVTCTLWDF